MSYNYEINFGLTASARWVIRSFLSLAFFKPAKAILVPGMYCENVSCVRSFETRLAHLLGVLEVLKSHISIPIDRSSLRQATATYLEQSVVVLQAESAQNSNTLATTLLTHVTPLLTLAAVYEKPST